MKKCILSKTTSGVFFVLNTLLFFGCGIKGPPLPPIAEKTVQEVSLPAEEKKIDKNKDDKKSKKQVTKTKE